MVSVSPLTRTACAVVASEHSLPDSTFDSEINCSLKSFDTTLSDSLVENIFSESNNPLCLLSEWKSNGVEASSDNATQFCNLFEGHEMCSDSKRLISISNAGGNSVFSEVLSFEFIKQLLGNSNMKVSLFKTEMELVYAEGSKITDFALKIENDLTKEGVFIGCSVTRCFNFLDLNEEVSRSSIKHLLKKKLEGVISSTDGVLNCEFEKQILHVWTSNSSTAELIKDVFENEISADIKSNTIVLVTIAESGFECLFKERGDDVSKAISLLGLSKMDASTASTTEEVDV